MPTTPLSPLSPSHQNLRIQSPQQSGLLTGEVEVDKTLAGDHEQENSFSSPKKMAHDADADPHRIMSYSTAHKSQTDESDYQDAYAEAEVTLDMPGSPVEYDGDSINVQPLRKQRLSLGIGEQTATPRKRSFELVPGNDAETGSYEPNKKGTGRSDVPEINVYADEESGLENERSITEEKKNIGSSVLEEKRNEGMSTVLHEAKDADEGKENMDVHEGDDSIMDDATLDDSHDPMDDTCLSTFSAVPNTDMTCFANLRRESPIKGARPLPKSPSKSSTAEDHTNDFSTPRPAKTSPKKNTLLDFSSPAASPTPRKRESRGGGRPGETPNLLDFTDNNDFFPRKRFSMQNERYSPSRRSPLRAMRESVRSPAKMSLLDFDIPAAPTPRSIPAITPRELESLKSGFMSEISSLKATLSGRDAEVTSLKQAVADAERRVGEALEEVRNEVACKEALEIEQGEWKRRGQEMEDVLRSVREEIVDGEKEKEILIKRIDEAEKSRDQLESRIVELESQLTAARKAAPTEDSVTDKTLFTKTAEETASEVQDAVEKVARELHTLYKGKHETKVAALKKSYEARWEKRVREAENKLKSVNEENERLKLERDNAMSEVSRPDASIIAHEKDEQEAGKRLLEAQIEGLQQEMAALKDDRERLRTELNMERAEKSELVAAVDEWLSIQQNQPPIQSQPRSPIPREEASPEPTSTETAPEEHLRSASRRGSSGTRPPQSTASGNGEKRIPKVPTGGIPTPGNRHARGNSGGKSGIAVFTPGRGGIMSSIERMGRGGS